MIRVYTWICGKDRDNTGLQHVRILASPTAEFVRPDVESPDTLTRPTTRRMHVFELWPQGHVSV